MVTVVFNFPVDTGRKLNVHKTFRRRPGRLLNVLCTFNLRPVSTGFFIAFFIDDKENHLCAIRIHFLQKIVGWFLKH